MEWYVPLEDGRSCAPLHHYSEPLLACLICLRPKSLIHVALQNAMHIADLSIALTEHMEELDRAHSTREAGLYTPLASSPNTASGQELGSVALHEQPVVRPRCTREIDTCRIARTRLATSEVNAIEHCRSQRGTLNTRGDSRQLELCCCNARTSPLSAPSRSTGARRWPRQI